MSPPKRTVRVTNATRRSIASPGLGRSLARGDTREVARGPGIDALIDSGALTAEPVRAPAPEPETTSEPATETPQEVTAP